MKILLINGSPNKNGCTNRALEEIKAKLKTHDIDSEIIWLTTNPMQDCISCGKCKTIGKCVFDDVVNQVSQKLDEACGIVIGSPVYYGGPTGRVCSFMDRLCYSAGKKLDGKIGASVVSCRRGGATSAYQRLNMYFGMLNAVIPTSQYWNQVHGFTPEDVEKDLEGLQTMRTLADNIAWLAKSINSSQNLVEKPTRNPIIPTHFIK